MPGTTTALNWDPKAKNKEMVISSEKPKKEYS